MAQVFQDGEILDASSVNTFEQIVAYNGLLVDIIGIPDMQIWSQGQAAPFDGGGGPFGWNADSTATPDGIRVIQPNGVTGAGRWVLVLPEDGGTTNFGRAFKVDPVTGAFVIVATGQSNEGGFGESNGVTTAGGDLYINQTGGGIWIWNGTTFVTAVYGTAPLTNRCPAPNNSLASNNAVAFANTLRASGALSAETPIYIIWEWASGTSISNQIGLKTVNGSLVGQFLLNLCYAPIVSLGIQQVGVVLASQGQRDSESSVGDTYTTGPFSSSQCFGNSIPPTAGAGALVAGTNPTYSLFSLPASVVSAINAAGGFNTYLGFQAALDWYVGGLLRSIPAIGTTTPILWYEIQGFWESGTGEYARTDALTYASTYGPGAADPYFAVVPAADLPTSAVAGNGEHFTSASQNIMGQRAFWDWAAMVSGSVPTQPQRDAYGNYVSTRYNLFVTGNIDKNGVSQSPDGLSYFVSAFQARNGLNIRSAQSTVIIPTAQLGPGGTDIDFYVWSTTNGPSYLCCLQAITGLTSGVQVTINGATYWQYTFASITPSPIRLSSVNGSWIVLVSGIPQALQYGGVIGVNPARIVLGVTAQTISSITNVGTLATCTTASAHGLTSGMSVFMAGQSPAAYAGTFVITVTGPNTFQYTMLANPGGSASTVGTYTVNAAMQAGQTLTLNGTVNGTAFATVTQAFQTSSDNTLTLAAAALLIALNTLAPGWTTEDIPGLNIIQVDAAPNSIGSPSSAASATLVFNGATSGITGTGTLPALSFDTKRSLSYADVDNQTFDLLSGTAVVLPFSNGTSGGGSVCLANIGSSTAGDGPSSYDCQLQDQIWTVKGKGYQGTAGATPIPLQAGYTLWFQASLPNRWLIVGGTAAGLIAQTQAAASPSGAIVCQNYINILTIYITNAGGPISAQTIDLPTLPQDGDVVKVFSYVAITTLTLSSSYQILGAPTSMSARTGFSLTYRGAPDDVWLTV